MPKPGVNHCSSAMTWVHIPHDVDHMDDSMAPTCVQGVSSAAPAHRPLRKPYNKRVAAEQL